MSSQTGISEIEKHTATLKTLKFANSTDRDPTYPPRNPLGITYSINSLEEGLDLKVY